MNTTASCSKGSTQKRGAGSPAPHELAGGADHTGGVSEPSGAWQRRKVSAACCVASRCLIR